MPQENVEAKLRGFLLEQVWRALPAARAILARPVVIPELTGGGFLQEVGPIREGFDVVELRFDSAVDPLHAGVGVAGYRAG